MLSIGPLPSSGSPSVLTTRPSSPLPTGTCSSLPVPRTSSPSCELRVVAEDDDADLGLVEVQRQAGDAVAEVEHLVEHDVGEAFDAGDAVADLADDADVLLGGRRPTAAAICASISCTRSAMSLVSPRCSSEPCFEARASRGPHAAIVDIAAHPDAHAADERGVHRERGLEAGAIGPPQFLRHAVAEVVRQRRRRSRPPPCADADPAAPAAGNPTTPAARPTGRRPRAVCATCRTRLSSSTPLTRHSRNNRRAARAM